MGPKLGLHKEPSMTSLSTQQHFHRTSQGKRFLTSLLLVSVAACSNIPAPTRLEPFPRDADYGYDLARLSGATSYSASLSNDGFLWPQTAGSADTAFLEIDIESSTGPTPSIVFRAVSVARSQYFEAGGEGKRFLDVSPLLKAGIRAGDLVSMDSSDVQWETGEASLVTFNNSEVSGRRVLVVAPHPDDAEIGAYGLYQDSNADVVTVTSGDAGGSNFVALWPDQGEQYRAKGRIRTIDSLTVPILGGLHPDAIRNLGYYDATLGDLWDQRPNNVPTPLANLDDPAYYRKLNFDEELRNRPFASNWQSLVDDLLRELEKVQPETVAVTHPLLDRHRDHKFAALALFEAMQRWGREVQVLLYTNHAVGNEAFPLGPRDGMTGLPAWPEEAEDLNITGLYSHQLSAEDQKRKLIALEAMHDLRPFDPRNGSDVPGVNPEYDYFRRGPRPNEIFFVTDLAGVKAIYADFFATYP